ncbi:L-threonylcarbamoyladenylate synthase [uncultured Thermanaerothrix sp.]|uniref:L-threonylcarbamoyladenylate synthase n=1 Tax=uncultured Thermanaerothrix sp. TaxID=1195149 RepID=UPI002604B902|nr:L-threonylcarbamoyladenylate synthase [uncultured Thermanaerothrix sp.]
MTTTRRIRVNAREPEPAAIAEAAALLRRGELVAFPTETVYGLGANALDARAVRRIFEAKGRPANDPLIVHLASAEWLPRVVAALPATVEPLAARFWPGPLTLILPRAPAVPPEVTAGLETVAVRVPAHPVALALLRISDLPIAAPSANRFGGVSPTTAEHVWHDLAGRVACILDGGPTPIGVESTVLDLTTQPPRILRPGGTPREALEAVLGTVEVWEGSATDAAQRSPGLLAKHYAPRARLTLVLGEDTEALLARVVEVAQTLGAQGERVGVLLADEDARQVETLLPGAILLALGPRDDLAEIARNLYAALRYLDAQGVTVIVTREFGRRGLGLAIRDRLRRAASQIITLSS